MRLEDKELEGPELEREQRLEVEEVPRVEDELPVLAGEQVEDVELLHRGRLFDALRLILAREQVNISLLHLPRRESEALEALQAAATGRHATLGTFVYAEDRESLLEQALAVLQQNLTHGDPAQLAELQARYDEMSGQVAELREELLQLEDAQEEIFETRPVVAKAEDEEDDEDKDEGDEGGDAAAAGSTLTGPERPEPPRPPSALAGPELRPEPPKPSTLSGPERPEPVKPPSTLGDPASPAEPPRGSRGQPR